MTGIWEAIWVIICFWPLDAGRVHHEHVSALGDHGLHLVHLDDRGPLFAAWNNSLNPC